MRLGRKNPSKSAEPLRTQPVETETGNSQDSAPAPMDLPSTLAIQDDFENSILDWSNEVRHQYGNGPGIDILGTDDFDMTTGFNNSNEESTVVQPDNDSALDVGLSSFNDQVIMAGLDPGLPDTVQRLAHVGDRSGDRSGDRLGDKAAVANTEHPAIERPMGDRRTDSQCVLECSQIISTMENYILTELKALDLCLTIVRQATEALNRLVDKQQTLRNFRCMALFSVVIYQIIELLDFGCTHFLSEAKCEKANKSPNTPSFGMGQFGIEAREQTQWRAGLLQKELQGTLHVLQRIIGLARLGPREASQSTPNDRAGCYREVQGRLEALSEQVKQYQS
ncbi:hypothetical protein G7Y79_00067g095570 [Physcia stellaris]|nr:hypothetical protein G7Y79_00067g095570 [Physcia stellaris]